MKNTKRIFASVLAVVMILMAMSLTAFAADETDGRIIIAPVEGSAETVAKRTFNIYKIFNATTSGSAISYQWYIPEGETESPYYDFFYTDWNGTGVLLDPADGKGDSQERAAQYMRSLTTDDLIVLSSTIYEYIVQKGIQATATQTGGDTALEVKFEGLEYGYYLIYDATVNPEVRSAVILTSVAPASKVNLKAEKPAISKVFNGSQKAGSATIGDTIPYTVTTVVPDHSHFTNAATYVYTVTDTVPAALELDASSIKVQKDGVDLAAGTDYVLTVDGQNITVAYKDILSYTKGTKLAITYSAVLGDTATAATHNMNTATLTYSNDPTDADSTGTVSSAADVHTYILQLTKVSSDNFNSTLNGARFKLYRVVGDQDVALNLVKVADGSYKVQEVADGATANDLEMEVNAAGVLAVEGLGSGNYTLVETVAPDGYKLPLDPFDFTIHEAFSTDGTNVLDNLTVNNISTTNSFGSMIEPGGNVTTHTVTAKVTNTAGTALPETGGMGTTLFTVGGILLMAAALGFFGVRRKNDAEA